MSLLYSVMMMHDLIKDFKRHILEKAAHSKRALFLHEKAQPVSFPQPPLPLKPKPSPPVIKKLDPSPLQPETIQKKTSPAPLPAVTTQFKEIIGKETRLTYVEKIPSDALAKQRARLWMREDFSKAVVIIRYAKEQQEIEFFNNLWKAIDEKLCPADIVDGASVEGQNLWDQLLSNSKVRWILCSHAALMDLSTLNKLYREDSVSKQRFIGNIPLLLLPSVQVFATNPAKKRELWNRLCQIMNPSGSPASSSTAL